MGGTTKKIDTTPSDITGLRRNLANWIQNPTPNPQASNQGVWGGMNQQTPVRPMTAGVDSTPQGFNGTQSWMDKITAPVRNQLNSQQQGGGGGVAGFDRMFSTPQGGPTQLGPTAFADNAPQINPAQVDAQGIPQVNANFNLPQINAQQVTGDFDPLTRFLLSGGQTGAGQIPSFMRDQVRDVNAPMSSFNPTQSVDALGGANSAFFRNMQGQLQPAFSQNRAEALAQAKAGLGNQGSGTALANSLGVAMNRSLGNEQATLANYASQGLNTEVGRQLAESQLGAQVGMGNAQRSLSGQMSNQGADLGFLQQLLGGAQLGQQGQLATQGLLGQLSMAGSNNALNVAQGNQGANLQAQGQNASNAINAANTQNNAQAQNQNAWMQAMLGNMNASNTAQGQNAANALNNNQFNAGSQNQANATQAGMTQAWTQLVNQMGMQNAQNFLNSLLGMSTTGVGPAQIQHTPGVGSAIGGIIGTGLGALAGPIGAGIGGRIGSQIVGNRGASTPIGKRVASTPIANG